MRGRSPGAATRHESTTEATVPVGGTALPADLQARLEEGASSLKVELDSRALERFGIFLQQLTSWNRKHNLTGIREPAEVVERHFLDGLTCVQAYDFTSERPVIDIGTGAGFPGLPLKIAFPHLSLCLLDSSIKKVEFLNHLCPLLGFADVEVIHGRAEEFGHVGAYRQKFHLALSRGVAPLPTLVELCLPFVAVGGYFIAQKNLDITQELADAVGVVTMLGGGESEQVEVGMPGSEIRRSLVVIRKEESTPSAYPRRPGMPAKRPLVGAGLPRRRKNPKYR